MHLSDLIRQATDNQADPIISGVSHDTRKIEPGFVFVAISGTADDGNRYIDDAIKKGAAAIITDQDVPEKSVPVIKVENSRACLAMMAGQFYRQKPNLIAAITGTNGKTSVAEFLRQIWQRMGWQAGSIGTLGIRAGNMEASVSLTTPDAMMLHQTLSDLNKQHITHVAMEASSHGIEQHRLTGLPVAVAGFTNLTRDHLDHHKTIDAYYAAKLRLFSDILVDGGTAVINIDSDYGKDIVSQIKSRQIRIITVGHSPDADFHINSAENLPWGQLVHVTVAGATFKVPLALLGSFQGDNAIMAAAMAHASGLEVSHALLSLPYVTAANGRMHSIMMPNSTARVVVDYAHTPDALENALKTLKPVAARLGVVFGCGGERDKGKRAEMGAIAAKMADSVIVTNDNPRREDPENIRQDILTACPQAENISDRGKAIEHGMAWLKDGDILLIAGKGHEDHQLIGDETLPFSDEGTVRAILRAQMAGGQQ